VILIHLAGLWGRKLIISSAIWPQHPVHVVMGILRLAREFAPLEKLLDGL
jgi:hypothetical protein